MNIVIALGVLVTPATGVPVPAAAAARPPRGLLILFFAEMWERFSLLRHAGHPGRHPTPDPAFPVRPEDGGGPLRGLYLAGLSRCR
ncbi:hypothetical protein ACRAWD_09510 [Caulobacter segnis]